MITLFDIHTIILAQRRPEWPLVYAKSAIEENSQLLYYQLLSDMANGIDYRRVIR